MVDGGARVGDDSLRPAREIRADRRVWFSWNPGESRGVPADGHDRARVAQVPQGRLREAPLVRLRDGELTVLTRCVRAQTC